MAKITWLQASVSPLQTTPVTCPFLARMVDTSADLRTVTPSSCSQLFNTLTTSRARPLSGKTRPPRSVTMDRFLSCKKGNQLRGKKLLKALAEKPPVLAEADQKVLKPGIVGKIASTLAADADFSSGLGHFFQDDDLRAHLSRHASGHQPGCTASYYDGPPGTHRVETLP